MSLPKNFSMNEYILLEHLEIRITFCLSKSEPFRKLSNIISDFSIASVSLYLRISPEKSFKIVFFIISSFNPWLTP